MEGYRSHQYHMKPAPGSKFMKRDVEKVAQKIIEGKVPQDKPYSYEDTMTLSKELCADIQQAVQALGYDRYKLVVQVTVAEAAQQGIRIASRCLWDAEVDNYAEYTHSTQFMHVNAIVFGLYWE